MGKFYSLLTSVGIYEQNLSLLSYEMDLKLMENALIEGLRLSKDTIRTLGSSGIVKMRSFVRVLMEFSSMIEEEDGFILYFSGHGCNGDLCFSDGMINIQSIIDFVEKLKSKNKIIILDCCYSGKFYVSGAKQMKLEEAITTFAGNGTVVLASSSSNESSWLGPGKNHSLYTGMLTTAMTVNRRIRKGKISIFDIHEEVLAIAKAWNKNNPMIPGSSLKGKMRSLLAKEFNEQITEPKGDHERISRLFGSSEKNKIKRSRLLFSDMVLANEQELREAGLQSMTEVKFENSISRLTAVANPRQIERAVRGSVFGLNLIYEMENEQEFIEDMQTLAEGMKLLQYDYLGGSGSRGYGKIQFNNVHAEGVIGNVDNILIDKCNEILKEVVDA